MTLQYIYVVRHGFRSNWLVNPTTGHYSSMLRTPTGIPADPELTAHGVEQARELAAHLRGGGLSQAAGHGQAFPVERIYSSPFYRCLQTLQPFVEGAATAATPPSPSPPSPAATASSPPTPTPPTVLCHPGLVDWFGPAPFAHPQPAPVAQLRQFFPWVEAVEAAVPAEAAGLYLAPPHGETMAQLHARVAAALADIVRRCDADGVRTVLICSHAATIIAMGRALTGRLPADVETEDFGAFTCGLSVYGRRGQQQQEKQQQQKELQLPWDPVHLLERQTWTGGRGIGGGWDCLVNCDCSFLSGGEERGWRFSGDDESFTGIPTPQQGPIVDAGVELGVVVTKRRSPPASPDTATTPAAGGKQGQQEQQEEETELEESQVARGNREVQELLDTSRDDTLGSSSSLAGSGSGASTSSRAEKLSRL